MDPRSSGSIESSDVKRRFSNRHSAKPLWLHVVLKLLWHQILVVLAFRFPVARKAIDDPSLLQVLHNVLHQAAYIPGSPKSVLLILPYNSCLRGRVHIH